MRQVKLSLIFALVSTMLVVSCKKDDDSNPSTTNVPSILSQGDWRITLYNDSGTDELYYFTGYTFTFSNGTVTATKNNSSVVGTYSAGNDDSTSKLYLDFGATAPFEKLNDDWHIIEETATKIRLEDVSGGNGGTDLLTFEKN